MSEIERIVAGLSDRMRKVILWMPGEPFARDWAEAAEAFGPGGSHRNTFAPLINRMLLERTATLPSWFYRLSPLGLEVQAALLRGL